jgi:hypothetical protein
VRFRRVLAEFNALVTIESDDRNEIRDMRMTRGRVTALVIAMAMGPSALLAQPQTLPWPGENRPTSGGAPWPGEAPAATASSTSADVPPPMTPRPGPGPMMSPMGAPPGMGAPGMASPGMGAPGGEPPCLKEFIRLRGDTEKHGAAAKAGSERKVPREQMCKLITSLFTAESKWFKYAEANAASCGIPPQLVTQLKSGYEHMATVRKNVCAAGPAAAQAPPSLSEALGTANLPAPSTTTTKRGGAFDSLTGNVVR